MRRRVQYTPEKKRNILARRLITEDLDNHRRESTQTSCMTQYRPTYYLTFYQLNVIFTELSIYKTEVHITYEEGERETEMERKT